MILSSICASKPAKQISEVVAKKNSVSMGEKLSLK